MKINECAVVDKEALQLTIKILELSKLSDMQTKIDTNNVNIVIKTLEEIIKNSKPLEPIVRDAWNCGEEIVQHEIHLDEFCHHNCDHINPKYVTVDQYINQTEI